MKLLDVIILVCGFVCLIIGIHQSILFGIAASYWIFMFSMFLLFLYVYRRGKVILKQQEQEKAQQKANKKKKKKKKK